LIKGCGAPAILWGSSQFFVFILNLLPGAIDRQEANLNTFFNLILGLAALPLLSPISRGLTFLIESQAIDDSRELDSYLDPLLLQAPSLALNQAAREELRLLDEIKLMLRTVWMMIWGKNVRLVSKVEEHQRLIEGVQEELKDYLSQISDENLGEEDVDWKFIVLDYCQELTAIATLIRRDLCDAAIRQIQLNQEPSPEDKEELEACYARTLERIEKAAALLMLREPRLAEEFIREKEQINVESRRSRKTRLEKPLSVQSASSNVVDMINCLRRINSQLTALAYAIVRDSTRSGKHPFTVLDWNWKKRGRWKRAPTRSKATEMLRQASAKIAPTERNSSFCRLSCGSTSRALAERLGAIISKAPTNDYDSTLTGNKGPLVSPFFRTLLGQERGAPPGESGSGG
jgi:Na+/phosphate symporter